MSEHKIVITFKDEGSVICNIEIFGTVYSDQFGMLSNRFNYLANRMREDSRMAQILEEEKLENRNKIAIPTSKDGIFR